MKVYGNVIPNPKVGHLKVTCTSSIDFTRIWISLNRISKRVLTQEDGRCYPYLDRSGTLLEILLISLLLGFLRSF